MGHADDSPPFVGAVPTTLPAPNVLVVVAWPEVCFECASAEGLWYQVETARCYHIISYASIHKHVCVCMYIYIHIYMHVHIYICICVYRRTSERLHQVARCSAAVDSWVIWP